MPSLEAQCLSTAAIVAHAALGDENWRAFGYRKRPRRGKLFHALPSAGKLERETTLTRELYAAGFGAVFCWVRKADRFAHRTDFLGRLLEFCVDGVNRPIWPALRFATRLDAVQYLIRASRDYASEPQAVKVFVDRCIERLSEPITEHWLIGAAWLFVHPESFVVKTEYALNRTGVAENPENDIRIEDRRFHLTAAKLLRTT